MLTPPSNSNFKTILDLQPSILGPRPSILGPGPNRIGLISPTLNTCLSILGPCPSILGHRPTRRYSTPSLPPHQKSVYSHSNTSSNLVSRIKNGDVNLRPVCEASDKSKRDPIEGYVVIEEQFLQTKSMKKSKVQKRKVNAASTSVEEMHTMELLAREHCKTGSQNWTDKIGKKRKRHFHNEDVNYGPKRIRLERLYDQDRPSGTAINKRNLDKMKQIAS